MSSLYSNSIRIDHNKISLIYLCNKYLSIAFILNLFNYIIFLRKIPHFLLTQYILY